MVGFGIAGKVVIFIYLFIFQFGNMITVSEQKLNRLFLKEQYRYLCPELFYSEGELSSIAFVPYSFNPDTQCNRCITIIDRDKSQLLP